MTSHSSSPKNPRIALTLGDVAGIGPELVARVLSDERLRDVCRLAVVGEPQVLSRALALIGCDRPVSRVTSLAEVDWRNEGSIACWNASSVDVSQVMPGKLDARAGRAAYDSLVGAATSALRGEIDALVTAPLNKAALHLAGLDYPGHTEILAEVCGVSEFAMMLHLPQADLRQEATLPRGPHGISVAHVTLHTSIRSVPGLLDTNRIRETIELVDGFLKRIGCATPRVGVCALNPHAGEGGLFGDEESRLIAPAVEAARRTGINAIGPLPADTLLRRAAYGEFDGIAAMYHDQGHIALKLIGFDRAVNVTLGIPIIRTSPSHGTAFDIAWQTKADPEGFLEAILTAAKLATSKQPTG